MSCLFAGAERLQWEFLWLELCDVCAALLQMKYPEENFTQSSLIYVPNRFVIAGGRFREFYYWYAPPPAFLIFIKPSTSHIRQCLCTVLQNRILVTLYYSADMF